VCRQLQPALEAVEVRDEALHVGPVERLEQPGVRRGVVRGVRAHRFGVVEPADRDAGLLPAGRAVGRVALQEAQHTLEAGLHALRHRVQLVAGVRRRAGHAVGLLGDELCQALAVRDDERRDPASGAVEAAAVAALFRL
jgi:hypothetical protein